MAKKGVTLVNAGYYVHIRLANIHLLRERSVKTSLLYIITLLRLFGPPSFQPHQPTSVSKDGI